MGSPESRNAVLLIHGMGGSPAELRRQGRRLKRQGYYCLAIVLPGHVGTPEDLLATTWIDRLNAAQAALDALSDGGRRWVGVTGLSMGGSIALHLAATNPDKVSAVATMAAPLEFVGGWQGAVLPWVARVVRWRHSGDGNDLIQKDRVSEIPSYSKLPFSTLAEAMLLLRHTLRRELRDIAQPALIMHGLGDGTIAPSNARGIMDLLVNCRYKQMVLLRNSGHGMTVDSDCDEVSRRLAEFFDWARLAVPRFDRPTPVADRRGGAPHAASIAGPYAAPTKTGRTMG